MTTRKGPMTVECAGGDERFAADLKAYVDGELTPLRRAAVRRHLAACASCRKEVEGMGEITRLLKEGDVPGIAPVGAALRARLIDTMQTEALGEPERRTLPLWRARPVAVFGTAGAVLAAAGVAFVGMNHPALQSSGEAKARQVSTASAPAPAVATVVAAPQSQRQLRSQRHERDYLNQIGTEAAAEQAEPVSMAYGADAERAKGAAVVAQEFKQAAPPPPAPAAAVAATGAAPIPARRPMSRGASAKAPAAEAAAPLDGYVLDNPRAEAEADGDAGWARQAVPALPAERQVHREASIGVTVAKVEAASEKVEGIVAATNGGFIASNDLNTAADGVRTADLTLRVPVREFDAVMRQLAALGEVVSKSVRGEDITEKLSDATQAETVLANEVRDADKRLKAGRLSERRTTAKEYELRQLKVQHAQAQARLGLLRKMGTLATIEVRLSEKPAPAGPPKQSGILGEMGDTGRAAALAFQSAVRVPVVLLVWALALSPLWAPLLIAYRVAARRHASAAGVPAPDR